MILKNIHYKFIILLLIVVCNSAKAQNVDINNIRSRIEKASFDEDTAFQLAEDLSTMKDKDALLTAFQASAEGILCLYIKNPVKLLKHAKNSSTLIDNAVEMDDNSLEIRFIRFTIEKNIPKILGYSKHQKLDRAFLLKNFKKENFDSIPYNSLEKMIHTLEESNKFSNSEITAFKAEIMN